MAVRCPAGSRGTADLRTVDPAVRLPDEIDGPSGRSAQLPAARPLLEARPVVSFSHEFLVDLFRARGELAPALLRWLDAGIVVSHDRVEQRSIDLSQVVPTEYRADAVVVLHDRSNAVVQALIVEVQLHVDRDKERTWPVYITALRHKLDCPVVLVVVTPSPEVAGWASRPIDLGHPGLCLTPVVVELRNVPRVVDLAHVQKIPELGVLSAMANPDLEVATTALAAVSALPEDRATLYLDVIMAALPPLVRKALEMQGHLYQSEFARKYFSQGREQGCVDGLRRGVLAVMRTKLDAVSSDDVAAVEAMRDEQALTELLIVLSCAADASEVRAALTAARNGELYED